MKINISRESLNYLSSVLQCYLKKHKDDIFIEDDIEELNELRKFLDENYFKIEERFIEIEITGSNPF